jgi:hypothetical protein
MRVLLVLAHQPGIARNIGHQHRRQPALDPLSEFMVKSLRQIALGSAFDAQADIT